MTTKEYLLTVSAISLAVFGTTFFYLFCYHFIWKHCLKDGGYYRKERDMVIGFLFGTGIISVSYYLLFEPHEFFNLWIHLGVSALIMATIFIFLIFFKKYRAPS